MYPITINFEAQSIIISHTFSKRAGHVGSSEYYELIKVIHDFPNYTLRVKPPKQCISRSPFSTLTYKAMEEAILTLDNKEKSTDLLKEFEFRKLTAGYARTKQWFVRKVVMEEMPDYAVSLVCRNRIENAFDNKGVFCFYDNRRGISRAALF